MSRRLYLCFVEFHHFLHVIPATQINAGPLVYAGRHDVKDTLGTSCGDAPGLNSMTYSLITSPAQGRAPEITYLLRQIRHRERLVKQPELPFLAFLVIRIPKDATIKQRPVYIGDHTSDISSGVRGFSRRWILDALEIVDGGRVEIQRIPFIERVDFATRRYLDIRMGEHELTECSVERVTVDTIARRKDKVRRRTVPKG